ncbi:thioesterase domain-containing protein [Streptomyces chartreusis]
MARLLASGEGTPLLRVHPGVGQVLVALNLTEHFVGEPLINALPAKSYPGFAGMIGYYADAIRRVRLRNSYALAGYSFGATVAFEIAELLDAGVERAAFLGLPSYIKCRADELDFAERGAGLDPPDQRERVSRHPRGSAWTLTPRREEAHEFRGSRLHVGAACRSDR